VVVSPSFNNFTSLDVCAQLVDDTNQEDPADLPRWPDICAHVPPVRAIDAPIFSLELTLHAHEGCAGIVEEPRHRVDFDNVCGVPVHRHALHLSKDECGVQLVQRYERARGRVS